MSKSKRTVDEHGVLVRFSELDGAVQLYDSRNLRSASLYLSHYFPLFEYPVERKMYDAMRRNFYWPRMATDVRRIVENWRSGTRGRQRNIHQHKSHLFPPNEPSYFVSIDILGFYPRKRSGHQFVMFMTDVFTNLAKTVPTAKVLATIVTKVFLNNGRAAMVLQAGYSRITECIYIEAIQHGAHEAWYRKNNH